jgi:hypothetical protein
LLYLATAQTLSREQQVELGVTPLAAPPSPTE